MKTKENIRRFFANYRAETSEDENEIRQFFGNRRIKLNLQKDKSDYGSRPTVTFEQVERWYDANLPDIGQLIVIEQIEGVCLVVEQRWDSYTVGVVLLPDNSLSFDLLSVVDTNWQPATENQICAMQNALSKVGMTWCSNKLKLEDRAIPVNPAFTRLLVMGKVVGVGIFKGVLTDGRVEMFCVNMLKDGCKLKLNEIIGNVYDYSFGNTCVSERAQIHEMLADLGLIWNCKLQRIEPNNARLKIGEKYWYLTSMWLPKQATEMNLPKDYDKFKVGNYYKTREAAERVRSKIINFCKEEILPIQ